MLGVDPKDVRATAPRAYHGSLLSCPFEDRLYGTLKRLYIKIKKGLSNLR